MPEVAKFTNGTDIIQGRRNAKLLQVLAATSCDTDGQN